MNEINIIENFHKKRRNSKQFFLDSGIKEFSEEAILYHCEWRLRNVLSGQHKYVDEFIEKKLIEMQPSSSLERENEGVKKERGKEGDYFSPSFTRRINEILIESVSFIEYNSDNQTEGENADGSYYQKLLTDFIFSLKVELKQKELIAYLSTNTDINASHIFTMENYPENFLSYKISFPKKFLKSVISSAQLRYSNIEIERMLLSSSLLLSEDEEAEEEGDVVPSTFLWFHNYFFKKVFSSKTTSFTSKGLSKEYISFLKNLSQYTIRVLINSSKGKKFFCETSIFTLRGMFKKVKQNGMGSLLKEVASSSRWEELKYFLRSLSFESNGEDFSHVKQTLNEWKNLEIKLIQFVLSIVSIDIEGILSSLTYSKCLNKKTEESLLSLMSEIESRPPLVVLVLREMILNNTLRISRLGLFS